jgi:hypothetical protein
MTHLLDLAKPAPAPVSPRRSRVLKMLHLPALIVAAHCEQGTMII